MRTKDYSESLCRVKNVAVGVDERFLIHQWVLEKAKAIADQSESKKLTRRILGFEAFYSVAATLALIEIGPYDPKDTTPVKSPVAVKHFASLTA